MRILMDLVPQQETPQPLNHHHIQASLYNLLNVMGIKDIHSEQKYKFFCFSNIFPFKKNIPFKKNEQLHLMISSPKNDLIEHLKDISNIKPQLRIGKYNFLLNSAKIVNPKIPKNNSFSLKSETQIVVTIHPMFFDKYNIKSNIKKLYWTEDMPLNAFIDGLNRNLIKKYNEFYGKSISTDISVFRHFKLVDKPRRIEYKNNKNGSVGFVIAGLWKFDFDIIENEEIKNLLNFALDCGLGEKNGAGFGFINLER